MARDPLIPHFTPSMGVAIVSRPKTSASALNGVWNLKGSKAHYGVHTAPGQLVNFERRLLAVLLDYVESEGESFGWSEYGDALAVAEVENPEYWIASAMIKCNVDTIAALCVEVAALNLLAPGSTPAPLPNQVGNMAQPLMPG